MGKWKLTVEQRFWGHTNSSNLDGCWLWVGAKNELGYGNFYDGKVISAHRFAYKLFRSPIPEGLEIDHLCRNRACVNPKHLEAVSHRTNTLRGNGPTALHARATHCKHGHLFDDANTYINPKGHRNCRPCRRIGDQKRAHLG